MRIPIDLAQYILQHKLTKTLAVYACLNTNFSGKVRLLDAKALLLSAKGCGDIRTVSKHLSILRGKGWLGYNPASGYLFIRSIARVQELCGLAGRKTVSFKKENCKSVQAFLGAAVLGGKINSMAYAKRKEDGRRFAVKQRDAARQNQRTTSRFGHNGLGLSKPAIASLLSCSGTRAVELKHAAENAGYIQTNKQFETLLIASSSDKNLRANVLNVNPQLKGRLRFKRLPNGQVEVLNQIQDEIIPMLRVRRANW